LPYLFLIGLTRNGGGGSGGDVVGVVGSTTTTRQVYERPEMPPADRRAGKISRVEGGGDADEGGGGGREVQMRQQKLKQMQERKQQLEQQKNQKEPPVPLPPPPGAAAAAAAVATKQEKTGPVTKFIGKNLALNADHPSGRPHNPQMIRKTVPPPRALHGRDKEVLCKKGGQRGLGDGDYRMLSKIKVADEALIPNKPRLFCGIYTHEKAHTRQVKAVRDTWANKCDGFAFFSTGTANRDIGTVEILHEGEEGYNK